MTIWTAAKSASTTNARNVPKMRMSTVTVNANSLLPNSAYTFWVNGVDMTWACRTPGTKQGASLVSDASGFMTIYFSCELSPAYSAATSATRDKYHSMTLKDINGNVKALSLVQQTLIRK